ncbi:MAG: DUF192 domain-containing protein, partial [Pseudorhodobacter sp.]|nr:DUF192 domain-containing protein [Pseudorhodobacter sp.]
MGKFGAAVILGLSVQAASAACAPDTVELRSVSGAVMRFSVELADDAAERELGLMNRDRMAKSAGMLFAYPEPHHVYFWMKNTLIPLDMVFADAAGQVVQVHSNAVPMDETPIDGGDGVTFVLEINGGLAARLGLTKGAVMR